jgi:hypothetical protein
MLAVKDIGTTHPMAKVASPEAAAFTLDLSACRFNGCVAALFGNVAT